MKAVSYRDLLNGSSHHENSQEALLLTGQRRFRMSRTPSHKDTGNSIWQQLVGRWLRSLKDMVQQRGSRSPALTLSVGARCAPALSSLISAWMWPVRAAVCRGVLPSCSQAG